jgi:hypothetical protein
MRAFSIFLVTIFSSVSICAQHSATGRLRIYAEIEGSLSVVFTAAPAAPIHVTGSNMATFTVPTIGGSFSMNSAPITLADKTFLISSPFEIQVTAANLQSGSYSLKSRLNNSDPAHSWIIDGAELAGGGTQVISDHEAYGVPNAHTLTVSGTASAIQSLNNSITFQVVAN